MYTKPVRGITILAMALMLASLASAQSFKVAVFDPQRVSEETAAGKGAATSLEAIRNVKQQDITGRESEINGLQDTLKQQALSLSIDKRTALELNIQRKLLELQSLKDMATRELQLEIAAEEAKFNEKLRVVIDQFARDEAFALILDRGSVAWASASVDITTAIIDKFDQVYPASGK